MEKIIVSCLESRVEANRSIYARFLLGPFTDDHAVTIATALRRALLSKVKSTGITALHIQGITHEFSTIVGVRESVLDLALNFQQIVFRIQIKNQIKTSRTSKGLPRFLHGIPRTQSKKQKKFSSYSAIPYNDDNKKQGSQNQSRETGLLSQLKKYGNTQLAKTTKKVDFKQKNNNYFVTRSTTKNPELLSDMTQIGYLQIRGPAVIYANDLQLPLGVECVDPTQYIATLSTEGVLVVKFLIGKKKIFFYHDTSLVTSKKSNTGRTKLMQKPGQPLATSETVFRYMKNGVLQASLHQRAPTALFENVTLKRKTKVRKDETFSNTVLPNKAPISDTELRLQGRKYVPCKSGASLRFCTRPELPSGTGAQLLAKLRFARARRSSDSEASTVNPNNYTQPSSVNELGSNKGGDPQIGSSSTNYLRNTIFLDPLLDSVSQVNYIIEKDDLSNQPRERIVLELWTNGSIHPRQAIHQASLSLISTFSIFRKMFHLYSW